MTVAGSKGDDSAMLTIENIANLRLSGMRLAAHQQMPAAYEGKTITKTLAATADAVIGEILGIDPEVFESQLKTAREHGVSYLYEHAQGTLSGVSAYVSMIKDTRILDKKLIIPTSALVQHQGLISKYILGAFILTPIRTGIDNVIVAGWTDVMTAQKVGSKNFPDTFKSELPVIGVSCRNLRPLSELIPHLVDQ